MINFVDHKSFILSSGTNDHAETVITGGGMVWYGMVWYISCRWYIKSLAREEIFTKIIIIMNIFYCFIGVVHLEDTKNIFLLDKCTIDAVHIKSWCAPRWLTPLTDGCLWKCFKKNSFDKKVDWFHFDCPPCWQLSVKSASLSYIKSRVHCLVWSGFNPLLPQL